MSVIESDEPAAPKLAIWQAVKAAYRETFGNPRALILAAAVPVALSFGIDLLYSPYAAGPWRQFPATVLDWIPAALFAITWLRFHLIKMRKTKPRIWPRPGRRFLPFAGYSLLTTLAFLLGGLLPKTALVGLPGYTAGAVFWLLYGATIYLVLRFSFIFAWIAVDQPAGLRASWQATRGNGLRLLFAVVLAQLPVYLATALHGALLALLTAATMEWTDGILYGLPRLLMLTGSSILSYVALALSMGIIVQAFSLCTGWQCNRDALVESFE